MMTVVDANLVPLVIALLIGIAIGWWMFARHRAASKPEADTPRSQILQPSDIEPLPGPARPVQRPAQRPRPIRDGIDTQEGRGLADAGALATADVANQILGTDNQRDPADAGGPPDNLQMLKGVGPKLALRLNENGIFRFDQLASLSHNEVTMLDDKLGPFRGRISRDRVVEQAAYLARGDRDGFEARFGKLGSP